MKRYILFDLDGTLADSMVGVTKAIQQGLHSQGIEVADYRDLRALVGPPSQEAYVHQYGMTAAQAKEAHRYPVSFPPASWRKESLLLAVLSASIRRLTARMSFPAARTWGYSRQSVSRKM